MEIFKDERHYRYLHTRFARYCNQLVIIRLNSQKYDIPLIKHHLPASLAEFDSIPHAVIKKKQIVHASRYI